MSVEEVATLARDQIHAIDSDVRVLGVAPFRQLLDRPLARPRFNAFLLSVFGGAALSLATIGLYAVLAASVRQRDRELAIRVALGATPMMVRRLVVGEALWLAGTGAMIGLVAAIGGRQVRAQPALRGARARPSHLARRRAAPDRGRERRVVLARSPRHPARRSSHAAQLKRLRRSGCLRERLG